MITRLFSRFNVMEFRARIGETGAMELTAQIVRHALLSFMDRKDLKVAPWSRKAGISDSALRGYLNGASNDMTLLNVAALAGCFGLTIDQLLSQGGDYAPAARHGADASPETATRLASLAERARLRAGDIYVAPEHAALETIARGHVPDIAELDDLAAYLTTTVAWLLGESDSHSGYDPFAGKVVHRDLLISSITQAIAADRMKGGSLNPERAAALAATNYENLVEPGPGSRPAPEEARGLGETAPSTAPEQTSG